MVWSQSDLADTSSKAQTTLQNFLSYREKYLVNKFSHDYANLLTGEVFETEVLGMAEKGGMCSSIKSGGIAMYNEDYWKVAFTVAHEMGHSFGLDHDKNHCCEPGYCVMTDEVRSIIPTQWSSCSINQLHKAFANGLDYCLKNKPPKLFDSSVCGNGFVEEGEECDCGHSELCSNMCCDSQTCKLYSNAT